eukprot:482367_1
MSNCILPTFRLLGSKAFGALQPIRASNPLIPYGGTYHWYLSNPKEWENAKTWFPFKAENDILITSYPKCGHHYTQKLCLEIIKAHNNGIDTPELYKDADIGLNSVPCLELYVSQRSREEIEQRIKLTDEYNPRLWFTHHSFNNIPMCNIGSNHKIITMIRNPKDCITSSCVYFNGLLKQIGKEEHDKSYNLDDLISYFVRGIMPLGCYFEWYESYWIAMKESKCNMLWLHYEDVVTNPMENIKIMAHFMFDGKENISPNGYEEIVKRTSFNAMKEEIKNNPQSFDIGEIMMRKGINNDWKEYFDEAQSELIDETMYFKWAENANGIRYYTDLMNVFNEKYNKGYFQSD